MIINPFGIYYYILSLIFNHTNNLYLIALLAQLDRVFDFESKGWGFESLRAHHSKN